MLKVLTHLTEFYHVNLFRAGYLIKGKGKIFWEFASRLKTPRCLSNNFQQADAVIIVPTHLPTGNLIMIKEFRYSLGRYLYGFPAGLVDGTENIIDTIKRELFEETGLNMLSVKQVSPMLASSAGLTDECVKIAFVECNGEITTAHLEEKEDIEVLSLSKEALHKLLIEPDAIFDARAWPVINGLSQT